MQQGVSLRRIIGAFTIAALVALGVWALGGSGEIASSAVQTAQTGPLGDSAWG